MEFYHIIIGVSFAIVAVIYLRPVLSKKARNERSDRIYAGRVALIEDKIVSIGGMVTKVEQIKKIDYPLANALQDDGSVNVFYRVEYLIQGRVDQTWAIINVKQSAKEMVFPLLDQEESLS